MYSFLKNYYRKCMEKIDGKKLVRIRLPVYFEEVLAQTVDELEGIVDEEGLLKTYFHCGLEYVFIRLVDEGKIDILDSKMRHISETIATAEQKGTVYKQMCLSAKDVKLINGLEKSYGIPQFDYVEYFIMEGLIPYMENIYMLQCIKKEEMKKECLKEDKKETNQ